MAQRKSFQPYFTNKKLFSQKKRLDKHVSSKLTLDIVARFKHSNPRLSNYAEMPKMYRTALNSLDFLLNKVFFFFK